MITQQRIHTHKLVNRYFMSFMMMIMSMDLNKKKKYVYVYASNTSTVALNR